MARSWTRSQQRRYKAERRKQAARVADRLLGKKIFFPPNDDIVDALNYDFFANWAKWYARNPRSNIYMGGIST